MTIKPNTWISVKDAMPPKEENIKGDALDLIVIDDIHQIYHVEYYKPRKEFLTISDEVVECVTHWMLLSKPTDK